jgi:cyanophycin synthetase
MKILEIRALHGPNYWSIYYHKLIVMRLDLEDYEQKPTTTIPGFKARLLTCLPTISSHRCGDHEEDGLLKRIDEGTWAGHVIEHMALELQTQAGMISNFGQTRMTSTPGIYNVAFTYVEEKAGLYAASAAVNLFLGIAENRVLIELAKQVVADIQTLREIRDDVGFGPSMSSIIEEAERRRIPHIRLNSGSLVQLGYGVHQRRIQATVSGRTNMIAVEIADDKDATKALLDNMGVPVPPGYKVYEEEEIESAVRAVGYPVVVKPLDANQGRGISVGLTALEQVKLAFAAAKLHSKAVIIEKFLVGKDFRALVVNNKLVAVAERTPAHVIGDGKSTIAELVELANKDPRRGREHENVLTRIAIDAPTLELLSAKGYTPETVLRASERCLLKATANLSTGGTATDRTDEVHPYNAFICERVAQLIGLDIAGIDIVAPDIATPINENGGGVVEVNASPGFRMHLAPSYGLGRNVAEPVIDMLFPPGVKSRIPILAVTGTNGKTTTTRLLAHIMKGIGHTVGFTTTEGTYIADRLVKAGDNTGPASAQMVLMDPNVDIAVLECARGGIIRDGLGFDRCDVGVVMNVAMDHLGLRDIDTLEDLARLKAVIPESVLRDGHAVLNADDPLVFKMAKSARGKVAFFSMKQDNPDVLEHVLRGGVACVYEKGYISVLEGSLKIRVENVMNIPLTFSGRAPFMIQNALAATLAAHVHGVRTEDIRVGLTTFIPSTEILPGRLNLIEVDDFEVLIDYAHNPPALEALRTFIEKLPHARKTGIVGGIGDRRDDDTRSLGRVAATMFTQIIVKEDADKRGRKPGDTTSFVIEGIHAVDPELPVTVIESESDAIVHGLKNAKKNDLLVIFPEKLSLAIELVMEYKKRLSRVELAYTTPESADRYGIQHQHDGTNKYQTPLRSRVA